MSVAHHIIASGLILMLLGCSPIGKDDGMDSKYPGLVSEPVTVIKYPFPNPERGLYAGGNYYTPQDRLSPKFVMQQRALGVTIIYTGYYLTDFMESDISQEYLDMIDANMQVLRETGAKCLLRFAYKTDMYETGHPWDASPEWVHRHIEQLKPVLQRNSDVVLCLQAGFIGVWGEWAFTDHFVQGPKTPEEHALRKEVMLALLDALPADRQIAVRTPMFKKRMFLDSYADTLTLETAHDGSDLARICAHNDCFGADYNDMGTFTEKGAREFWKTESKYVMMGGETCQISNYCKCVQSIKDMEDYHWTYLSGPAGISNRWESDGCYDEILIRLGYRLYLTGIHHSQDAVPGEKFRIVLELKNAGFAAPMNPRDVELVFVDGNGKKSVYELDDLDPRYWFAGEKIVIDREVTIPSDASGECALYLNLPDPEETLHDHPYFSIRLANLGTWDGKTGYNRLIEFEL